MKNQTKSCYQTNSSIIYFDLASFLLGLVGIIFGILSLASLMPSWRNENFSYNITIAAIFFDGASFIFAFLAFFGTKKLIRKNIDTLKQQKNLYRFEYSTLILDFSSFLIGVIGSCFEIISILALDPFWDDQKFSYQVTIVAVIFDIFSALTALLALLLTIKTVKYHRQHVKFLMD